MIRETSRSPLWAAGLAAALLHVSLLLIFWLLNSVTQGAVVAAVRYAAKGAGLGFFRPDGFLGSAAWAGLTLLLLFAASYLVVTSSGPEARSGLKEFAYLGRARWPLLPLAAVALFLIAVLPLALIRKIAPALWVESLVFWLALVFFYLYGLSLRREERAPPVVAVPPPLGRSDVPELVASLRRSRLYRGQIVREDSRPDREDQFSGETPPAARDLLPWPWKEGQIEKVYNHQKEALDRIASGRNVALVQPVGSGHGFLGTIMALDVVQRHAGRVLHLCRTPALAKRSYDYLRSTLERAERDAPLRIDLFVSEEEDFNYDAERPDILFATPDTLHRGMLSQHERWSDFFDSLSLVVIEQAHTWNGVWGSNAGLVLRRLWRMCRQVRERRQGQATSQVTAENKATHLPQIVVTSAPLVSLQAFLRDLTGRNIAEGDVLTADTRGHPAQYTLYWNPCLERVEDPRQKGVWKLHRANFLRQTEAVFAYALVHGFDSTLLSKAVFVTPALRQEVEQRVWDLARELAEADYQMALRGAVASAAAALPDVLALLQEVVAAAQGVRERKRTDGRTPRAETGLGAPPELQFDELVETPTQLIAQLERRAGPGQERQIDDYLKDVETARTRMESILQGARAVLSAAAQQEGSVLVKRARESVTRWLNDLVAALSQAHKSYQRALLRAQRGRRFVGNNILEPEHSGPGDYDACLMSGFPRTAAHSRYEVQHLGRAQAGVPNDMLLVVVTPQTPGAQYYRTRGKAGFWREGPELEAALSVDNGEVLAKHLLCAIAEGELSTQEAEAFFGSAAVGLLESGRLEEHGVKSFQRVETILEAEGARDVRLRGWGANEGLNTQDIYRSVRLATVGYNPYRVVEATTRSEMALVDERMLQSACFPGAVLRCQGERARVDRVDWAEHLVLTRPEERPRDTQRLTKTEIRVRDTVVRDDATGGEVTRLVGSPESAGLYLGAVLALAEGVFAIMHINPESHTVHVNRVGSQPDHATVLRPEAAASEVVRLAPRADPLGVRKAWVSVREQVKGFAEYDCFDVSDPQITEREPTLVEFETTAVILTFPASDVTEGALHALVHLLKACLTTVLLCGEQEAEVVCNATSPDIKEPALFIYDNCPGGVGVSRVVRGRIKDLLERAYEILLRCSCHAGCPNCLRIFECRNLPPNDALEKDSTLRLLGQLLGRTGESERVIRDRTEPITDEGTARALRDRVLEVLGHKLGMDFDKVTPLVVDSSLSVAGQWDGSRVAVRPMTEASLIEVIAHEYAHDWQLGGGNIAEKLRHPSNVPQEGKLFVEGFAEWVAFRTLDFFGLEESARRFGLHGRAVNEYSAGFEVLRLIEEQAGVAGVMDFIRTGEGFELDWLYEKSGIKEAEATAKKADG
jgi:ATP-dependent helicase YprA (DUF1998 family)